MAEATARAMNADGVVVVSLMPPPLYVPAVAWRHDEQPGAARRGLDYLRSYRDRHAWISDPDAAPLTQDQGPGPVDGTVGRIHVWRSERRHRPATTIAGEPGQLIHECCMGHCP